MTTAKQVYEWVKTGHWNRQQFLEWAQPKQEPVAWRTYIGRGYYIIDPTFEDAQKNWPDKQHQPLYTSPPQRTWVGLTDEEIDQGLLRTPYAMKTAEAWREGVRWAYHQLKEKNT